MSKTILPLFNISCRLGTNFRALGQELFVVLAFAPNAGELNIESCQGRLPHLFSKRKNLTAGGPLLCHTAEYATSTADADLE
jgi:hypothetical protein